MSDFSSDDRKVIPLKLKNKPKMQEPAATDLKTAAAGSMAFVLLLVAGFNFSVFQAQNAAEKQNNLERSLASLDENKEHQWTKNLEQINKEMITQASHRPSASDSLGFGLLAGKYSIVSESGRVKEIRLTDISKSATVIRDRFEFIESYSAALAPGLNSIRKVSVKKTEKGKTEVYMVQSATGESKMEFTIGQQNQLLSLTIE
jgi:hypothetical protein